MEETILLQTATFSECFGFGPKFYGVATLLLFLPGLGLQVMLLILSPTTPPFVVHPKKGARPSSCTVSERHVEYTLRLLGTVGAMAVQRVA